MGLAIDASCDLPQEFLQQHNIAIMPIAVRIDESQFKDNRNPAEIARFLNLKLGSRSHSAETEPCSAEDVQKLFLEQLVLEKDCVFCVTITTSRSAIYDNVVKASFCGAEELPQSARARWHHRPVPDAHAGYAQPVRGSGAVHR
jgi:fatty acid-binding protein DegV